MTRKNHSLIAVLMEAPWWVSVIFAALFYLVVGHLLPELESESPMLNGLFKGGSLFAHYFSILFLFTALYSFINTLRKAKQLENQRSIDSIRFLHWRNFEELVAEAYRRQGYKVLEGGFGPDGGIDLVLGKEGKTTLVQCKHWKGRKVGVAVVREMFGVLAANDAAKIVIICSGDFTQEAVSFAENKPIELINGDRLVNMIRLAQDKPTIQEPVQKICPECHSKLVVRVARKGTRSGSQFLGCSRFPKCRYTEQIE